MVKRTAGGRPRSEERALLEAGQAAFLRGRVRATVAALLRGGADPDGPWPELEAALNALESDLRARMRNARRGDCPST
jgi:hypothetical protein